jgi:DtxR family Mn-dependent transcriptional regulator
MELTEKAEEVLEALWICAEETKKTAALPDLADADKETVQLLISDGDISLSHAEVKLTEAGQSRARSIVRRHRLAERLLNDVLGTGDMLMHEKACKFEHILDHGLDESICTLLGHPKICPHGKQIPPGRCCEQEQTQGQRVVAALSQLRPGQTGKVAYIHTSEPDQLQKMTAMGVLPGAPLNLLQDFPSYVFQIRQTQFAVDKEIADSIYVRLMAAETPENTIEAKPPKRWRLLAKK